MKKTLPKRITPFLFFLAFIFSPQILSSQCSCTATCSGGISDVNQSTANELYCAVQYLCGNNILDNDGSFFPDDNIIREDLAKIAFIGLYGSATAMTPADSFPTPFADLQGNWIEYYKYAKALSYLEYGDGISPFDRDFYNFKPGDLIERRYLAKVLVETFDIPLSTNTTSPYTDVPSTMAEFLYIRTLFDIGVLEPGSTWRPTDNTKRSEAFLILYKILCSHFGNTAPPLPNHGNASIQSYPGSGDYFRPGNYHPFNLNNRPSISDANFDAYSHTSFNIPGKNMPLVFAHNYNSHLTELPRELFPIMPLGRGWSHSYNSYIVKIPGYSNTSGSMSDHYVVFWPGGSMYDFSVVGGTVPSLVTEGVYDEITYSATQITIKKKNQMVYVFNKVSTGVDDPFVLKQIRDRNNNTITLSYSVTGGVPQLVDVTGTAGRKLNLSYDSNGFLTEVTDPIGRSVKYEYSFPQADMVKYTDAENYESVFSYSTAPGERHLLEHITLPLGNTIDNTYYQKKLLSTQTNISGAIPQQIETTIAHELQNGVYEGTTSTTTVNTNGVSRTSQYEKNSLGQIESMDSQTNDINSVEYNDPSNPTLPTRIIVDNILTEYEYYSGTGNVKKVIQPLGVIHEFTYTTMNDVATYINPRGFNTTFSYNGTGNLLTITDPIGSTSMTYNTSGQPTQITNPEGITVNIGYNSFGNQNMITSPGGLVSGATYDGASRMEEAVNPNGQVTTYEYDARDFVTKTIDALTHPTEFIYDGNGNLETIINAKGEATTLTYDINDFLKTESFGGFTKSYDYDSEGKLTQITKPDGTPLNYTYNVTTGNLENDSYATYTYDNRNRLETVTKDSETLTYAYDLLNRIISTTYDGQTVGYTYDPNGNVETITYPGNNIVTYTYDAKDRMTSVTDWNGNTTTYTFFKDDRLKTMIYPNGISTDYEYDDAGRITKLINYKSGVPWIRYVFELDELGNHLSEKKLDEPHGYPTVASENWTYTYNNINRIETASSDLGTNIAFSFDANGNTISKDGNTYSWDTHDMLTQVSGTFNATYTYDGLGNRRSANRNGSLTKFTLDVLGMSRVLIESDGSNAAQNYYIYGLGLVSRIKPSGDTRYYTYDFRGSTVAMTNDSGVETHTYGYDDFGGVVELVEEDFNSFRYVGALGVQYEADDLIFMRARYYDNFTGRFLSEDPIWSTNLYPYVGNNPIYHSDPSGMIKLYDAWKIKKKIGNLLEIYDKYQSYDKVQEAFSNGEFDQAFEEVISELIEYGLSEVASKFVCLKAAALAGTASLSSVALAPASPVIAVGTFLGCEIGVGYVIDEFSDEIANLLNESLIIMGNEYDRQKQKIIDRLPKYDPKELGMWIDSWIRSRGAF